MKHLHHTHETHKRQPLLQLKAAVASALLKRAEVHLEAPSGQHLEAIFILEAFQEEMAQRQNHAEAQKLSPVKDPPLPDNRKHFHLALNRKMAISSYHHHRNPDEIRSLEQSYGLSP